jgi:hypothetical protein
MSTARVRATPARPTTPAVSIASLRSGEDSGILVARAPDIFIGMPIDDADFGIPNSRYVSTVPFLMDRHYTGGFGTTGSPWLTPNAAAATALTNYRPVFLNSGYYGSATMVDWADKEYPTIRGTGGRTVLRYTGSTSADAVVSLQNTQHRLWSDIGGMMLDGGGHASRGIHGTRFSFSELGPISGGHFAAGAWLIEVTDTGGATYRHINTHSVVAADPTDDDYAGLAPPANGMHLSGSYNNRIVDCNLQGPNRAAGVGNYTGTGYKLDTDSFGCLLSVASCSFYDTGIELSGTGQEHTIINADTEDCKIGINCSIARGVAINCGGSETSAFITGNQFTMIGGRFPGATGTTNTATFKGAAAAIINHATVPIVTGVGASAVVINHPTWLDRGAQISLITATGASEPTTAAEGILCIPHSPLYGSDQGWLLIESNTTGKGVVIGNTVDDAGFAQPHALKVDGGGIAQAVLKNNVRFNVVLDNSTITQAITNSGNDLWFGNTSTNLLFTCGTGKEIDFYVNGAADYAMNIAGVNLSLRNHDIQSIANCYANRVLPTVVALTDQATITTDASAGTIFTVTLGGNRTMAAPTNPVVGQAIEYQLKQDGTGSRTLTWNAAFRFSGGSAPTLTTTNAKTDRIAFRYNGVDSKWDAIYQTLNL